MAVIQKEVQALPPPKDFVSFRRLCRNEASVGVRERYLLFNGPFTSAVILHDSLSICACIPCFCHLQDISDTL